MFFRNWIVKYELDFRTTAVSEVSKVNRVMVIFLAFSVLGATLSVATRAVEAAVSARERAVESLEVLLARYWNEDLLLFDASDPCVDCNGTFHYWWMAHAIDGLLDGYELTGDDRYLEYVGKLHAGIRKRNGGHLFNDYYDDMLWMGLALLRAHELSGNEEYFNDARRLWFDIRGGWNDHYGGGIAWRKTQRDYKNAPANGPAVILCARLYAKTGDKDYLDWAKRIYTWLDTHLVDPRTWIVWDGINRQGDGAIDKAWRFTYNQGTYIGASVALWEATGEGVYLQKARRTAMASQVHLTDAQGIFQGEGQGDGGLFKGILIRYLVELLRVDPTVPLIKDALIANAESAWLARTKEGTFGPRWKLPVHSGPVDLSTNLSGVMLQVLTARLD